MARVEIGRVTKAHGLNGEVVVAGVRLDADAFRALGTVEVQVGRDAPRRLAITAIRPFLHNWLVTFDGIEDRDTALALHGGVVTVAESQLPPAGEGEIYLFQLEGLLVKTDTGSPLGHVKDVMTTGAAPILVVHDGTRERLLPMSPDVLVAVDLEEKTIVVRMLPGLDQI